MKRARFKLTKINIHSISLALVAGQGVPCHQAVSNYHLYIRSPSTTPLRALSSISSGIFSSTSSYFRKS